MSISDKFPKLKLCRREMTFYFRFAVFCGMFAAIYENFGHGVYSNAMIYMFAYPAAGLAVYALIGFIKPLKLPSEWSAALLLLSVITLTIGSCVSGIVEIYGTTSSLTIIYTIVGIIFAAAAAVIYIVPDSAFKSAINRLKNIRFK